MLFLIEIFHSLAIFLYFCVILISVYFCLIKTRQIVNCQVKLRGTIDIVRETSTFMFGKVWTKFTGRNLIIMQYKADFLCRKRRVVFDMIIIRDVIDGILKADWFGLNANNVPKLYRCALLRRLAIYGTHPLYYLADHWQWVRSLVSLPNQSCCVTFYEGFGFKTTNTIFQNNVYINKLVLKWGGGGAGYQSGFLYKNNNNIINNDNNNN